MVHVLLRTTQETLTKSPASATLPTAVTASTAMLKALLESPRHQAARLAAAACPIVYATHFRNIQVCTTVDGCRCLYHTPVTAVVPSRVQAMELLLHAMSAAEVRHCLTLPDAYAQTVLHVATKSKAAGFAGFFARRRRQAAAAASPSPDAALPFLALQQPTAEQLSYRALTAAASDADVRLLVTAGLGAGLRAAEWMTTRDDDGYTAFTLACQHRRLPTVRYLLEAADSSDKDALLWSTNRWGMTCGHVAAAGQQQHVVEAWAAAGGDVTAVDAFNRTVGDITLLKATAGGDMDSITADSLFAGAAEVEDGGWGWVPSEVKEWVLPHVSHWLAEGRHVATVPAATLSTAAFEQHQRSVAQPLLVDAGCRNWSSAAAGKRAWSRRGMLQQFGRTRVQVGAIPYASQVRLSATVSASTPGYVEC